ncbi:MAG: flavin reductase [Sphaerochaetaceae bacterium]|jgi:flavin reductase (DIM6/NTAB) family NADH-FMN oxidoreductase RutF
MFQEISYEMLEMNPFTAIGNDGFLVTAGTEDHWNTMTASWGGFGVLWGKPVMMIFVRDSRYTFEFLEKAEGFTCSFFGPDMKSALSFCGSHSGRDVDKAAATGVIPMVIDAPDGSERITFEQANLVFSCSKAARIPFEPSQFLKGEIEGHYPEKDYHVMFVGFIDTILAQE